jgi:mRNA interferase MazF
MLDPGPTVGGGQSGYRPYLVTSIEAMNRAQAEIAFVMPLTTTPRENPLHVRIDPTESGLPRVSYAMPERVRSVSIRRFGRRVGRAPLERVETAAAHAGFLLGLGRIKF